MGSAFAALAAVVGGRPGTVRADYFRPPDSQAGCVAPPVVYVSETGHHMESPFARFWYNLGGARILGHPITETLVEAGVRTQYFENFRLQYFPSTTGEGEVHVSPLGREFIPFEPRPEPLVLGPGIAEFHTDNHGDVLLGRPLSPCYYRDRRWLQWFENGRLELRRGSEGRTAVWVTPLGIEAAGVRGCDTTPAPPEPGALDTNPRNFTRWFEADLGTQTLYFWEAGSVVHETKMSSGSIRLTPVGEWSIYRRVFNERMIGGEPDTPSFYDVENVLYTQYFTPWFDALHYAYWHQNFGRPTSHGCINLRLGDAWLAWQFGTYGTIVETHH